jgi:hypothetical protein
VLVLVKGVTMSVEAQKLEIIRWILNLKDNAAINEIIKMKNTRASPKTAINLYIKSLECLTILRFISSRRYLKYSKRKGSNLSI